MRINFIW